MRGIEVSAAKAKVPESDGNRTIEDELPLLVVGVFGADGTITGMGTRALEFIFLFPVGIVIPAFGVGRPWPVVGIKDDSFIIVAWISLSVSGRSGGISRGGRRGRGVVVVVEGAAFCGEGGRLAG